jgi:hypothetical protein
MAKRKNFNWRYQPPSHSKGGMLISYLQDNRVHPALSTKELILKALSAYYMPLAYSLQPKQNEKVLERIAYDSVFALQRQIDRLVCEFNLDVSNLGVYGSQLNDKSHLGVKNRENLPKQVVEANDSVQELEVEAEDEFNVTGLFRLISQQE